MALKFGEATNLSSGTSHDDACDALCGCAPRGQPLSRRSFLCSAAAAGLGASRFADKQTPPASRDDRQTVFRHLSY